MSTQRKYQVFVSSTHDDLIDERKEVTEAILRCDCIPAGMELWPASSFSQWAVIKSVINDSDYYLLIIAGKYGSEGIDEDGNMVSYTEMEFDYAVKMGKPVIALIHESPEQLPGTKIELDAKKRRKLDSFKKKVMDNRLVTFWTSMENVKTEAVLAIQNAIKKYPTNGWVKGPRSTAFCDVLCYYLVSGFEDTKEIADLISKGNIVLLDFDKLDRETSRRVLDFLNGNGFGTKGQLRLFKDATYIYAPEGIVVRNLLQEHMDKMWGKEDMLKENIARTILSYKTKKK